MGRGTFTRAAYASAHDTYVPRSGPATSMAEQRARETGKLHELVDPSGYGVVRPSRLRMEEQLDGLFELTDGTSMPVETRLDTTGSMGGNVDVAIGVLADAYELCSSVLPGYHLHMCIGIFGDVQDRFPLSRPQFEMEAEKMVFQLTQCVPERAGGDAPEDPHYGLFGAAYLTAFYINRIGLKGYDFTISDAPARDRLNVDQLLRIFGPGLFDRVAENGFEIDKNDLPSTKEVVRDLLKRAHAFFLQVGAHNETTRFWTDVFGPERVVVLPDTKVLPQVQAAIIGLTEGTLAMEEVSDFLTRSNVGAEDARRIERSVANIPIGAQVPLRHGIRLPQKGDLFRAKMDLWPIDPNDAPSAQADAASTPDEPSWL